MRGRACTRRAGTKWRTAPSRCWRGRAAADPTGQGRGWRGPHGPEILSSHNREPGRAVPPRPVGRNVPEPERNNGTGVCHGVLHDGRGRASPATLNPPRKHHFPLPLCRSTGQPRKPRSQGSEPPRSGAFRRPGFFFATGRDDQEPPGTLAAELPVRPARQRRQGPTCRRSPDRCIMMFRRKAQAPKGLRRGTAPDRREGSGAVCAGAD